jgi:carbonic anhydrase
MEKASIVNTLDNLMTFPRVRTLVERSAILLHGAYFGVASGELSVLDKETGEFWPVKPKDLDR